MSLLIKQAPTVFRQFCNLSFSSISWVQSVINPLLPLLPIFKQKRSDRIELNPQMIRTNWFMDDFFSFCPQIFSLWSPYCYYIYSILGQEVFCKALICWANKSTQTSVAMNFWKQERALQNMSIGHGVMLCWCLKQMCLIPLWAAGRPTKLPLTHFRDPLFKNQLNSGQTCRETNR